MNMNSIPTRLLYPEIYEQLDRDARKERKMKKKLAELEKLRKDNAKLDKVLSLIKQGYTKEEINKLLGL